MKILKFIKELSGFIKNLFSYPKRYNTYKYKKYEDSFYFYPITKEAKEQLEKMDQFISQR